MEAGDLYQDGCALFLTLLELGKINAEKMCNHYMWQRIGQQLKQSIAVDIKQCRAIQSTAVSVTEPVSAFDVHLANTFLSHKKLTMLQKQILYRFYCLQQDPLDISRVLNLSVATITNQRSYALKQLRKACGIDISHKKLKRGADSLRIWGPTRPKDSRCHRRTWMIRAREGKRGKEHVRYFETYVSAMNFRALVEEKGMGIFLKSILPIYLSYIFSYSNTFF
jgi:hypothetical protein